MFRVEWEPDASEQIALISMLNTVRWPDIDCAESDINYRLKFYPVRFSESVSEGLRRIISRPLVFYFTMEGDLISIVSVGWID